MANQQPPRSYDEILADIILTATVQFERDIAAQIARAKVGCESPIEEIFLAQLIATGRAFPALYSSHIYGKPGNVSALMSEPFPGTHVALQAKVDGFRLDLLIWHVLFDNVMKRPVVVELDGHDFHERTKAQATRDKARDRHFAAKGWTVIRFTGSEVWRDPHACVVEALNIALGLGDMENDF